MKHIGSRMRKKHRMASWPLGSAVDLGAWPSRRLEFTSTESLESSGVITLDMTKIRLKEDGEMVYFPGSDKHVCT